LLSKGIYSRSGPVHKMFKGTINQVIFKNKNIYAGTTEGDFARIDKKSF
jgi:hypothetical protein